MSGTRSGKQWYWKDLVSRQARSGQSVREFCSQEGVSEPSFYAWRRKLAAGSGDQGPGRDAGVGSPGGGEFIPLTLREDPGSLELLHPLGYRIRVTGQVDVAMLAQVLDLLDGRNAQ